jgi:hypothetical protein
MKFRFRKFLTQVQAASAGATAYPAPFTDSSAYDTYNAATGSGALRSAYFLTTGDAVVLSVSDSNPNFKEYFKRDWIEEDGIEIYQPSTMKHKASVVEIEMLIYAADATALGYYNAIKNQLATWGLFEYYDDYHKALKRLIADSIEMIRDEQRNTRRVIHFRIKCTNVLGYDILNFNPDTGGLTT